MDVKFEIGSHSRDVWPQSLATMTTSMSCPHLGTPSVVISDHSTTHEEVCCLKCFPLNAKLIEI